jgi:hypothetical protein
VRKTETPSRVGCSDKCFGLGLAPSQLTIKDSEAMHHIDYTDATPEMAAREAGSEHAGGAAADDLSNEHAPVSAFLSLSGDSWPLTAESWEKYKLTDEQIEQYDRDGCVYTFAKGEIRNPLSAVGSTLCRC